MNDAFEAITRRVRCGRTTGRNVSTRPDCHILYSAAPGPYPVIERKTLVKYRVHGIGCGSLVGFGDDEFQVFEVTTGLPLTGLVTGLRPTQTIMSAKGELWIQNESGKWLIRERASGEVLSAEVLPLEIGSRVGPWTATTLDYALRNPP